MTFQLRVTVFEPLSPLNASRKGTESPSRYLEFELFRSPFCQLPAPPLPGHEVTTPEPLAHWSRLAPALSVNVTLAIGASLQSPPQPDGYARASYAPWTPSS